jgi:hypothetical protein
MWEIGVIEALAYGADALTLTAVAVQLNTINQAQTHRIGRLDGYNKRPGLAGSTTAFAVSFGIDMNVKSGKSKVCSATPTNPLHTRRWRAC